MDADDAVLRDLRQRLNVQMSNGDYLAAHDTASDLLARGERDLRLRYLRTLALARSGATDRARSQIEGLAQAAADHPDSGLREDIVAMGARLSKEAALRASGTERTQAAAMAAREYERLYRTTGGFYPAINAATLWLLAGEANTAGRLAGVVLNSCRPPYGDYWTAASAAEAALVLGDIRAARTAIAAAADLSQHDPAARAVTRRQLLLVCDALVLDPAVLSPLAPITVIHYTGHRVAPPGAAGRFPAEQESVIAAEIGQKIDQHDVAVAYGSMAAGADVLVAEAVLARGAQLHVVLPFALQDFLTASVVASGPSWVDRFHRCLEQADSVSYSYDGAYLDDPVLFDLAGRVAMGDAVLRGRALDANLLQLAVWDGEATAQPAGTAADVACWRHSGRSTIVIHTDPRRPSIASHLAAPVRELRAMIFSDIAGFSQLTDAAIPTFMNHVMARIADTIDTFGDGVLLRQTWGDGVYLVMRDVPSAAQCALALQQTWAAIDLNTLGLGALRGMRIGGHAGPVFRGTDHVRREPAFYGSAVVRAARIEPRTPEGQVYVTHPFASLAALEGDPSWTCEYVGVAPTDKGHGDLPMFVLRTRGPVVR